MLSLLFPQSFFTPLFFCHRDGCLHAWLPPTVTSSAWCVAQPEPIPEQLLEQQRAPYGTDGQVTVLPPHPWEDLEIA